MTLQDLLRRVERLEAIVYGQAPLPGAADPEAQRVIDVVCSVWRVSPVALRRHANHQAATEARMAAMWLLRDRTDLSFAAIGRLVNRDHSTVQHACKRVPVLDDQRPDFEWRLSATINALGDPT